MGQIKYTSEKCQQAVVIGYNVSWGDDPQPLYEAGSPNISCVVRMEALAQASISKAIFSQDFNGCGSDSGSTSVTAPGLDLTYAVVKCNYSASSGQAYIVEQMQIIGKKA